MKTEIDINKDIIKITMEIGKEHPELLKYLNEMPITIPYVTNPEMTLKVLHDYYDSLKSILKKYANNLPIEK